MSSEKPRYAPRPDAGGASANEHLSALLNTWLIEHGPVGICKTCASCLHMAQQGPALCRAFNQTPPITVIMTGCEKYEDTDDIPF